MIDQFDARFHGAAAPALIRVSKTPVRIFTRSRRFRPRSMRAYGFELTHIKARMPNDRSD
jgi:hypothetical protein